MARDTQLHPAFLLHSRPFRDTSLLLECLTRDHGKVSLIARGARSAKSRSRGLLQPFIPLQISYGGKSELKTLYQIELAAHVPVPRGEQLFGALYLNELLVRLVHGHDTDHQLFLIYQQALDSLREPGADLEPVLRRFELALLDVLGYGFSLEYDAGNGESIADDGMYYFELETGFIAAVNVQSNGHNPHVTAGRYYPGKVVRNMANSDFSDQQTRAMAKQLLREVLAVYLGERPLKSRQLFPSTRLQ